MAVARQGRVVCLSNPYDENYRAIRKEAFAPYMSAPKRRDLFRCLEMATGRELLVLSCPPKATVRRTPRLLRPVTTRFSSHRQLFCANLDAPKLRVPCSWAFYAVHVLRHTRHGDVLVLDNFELSYVLAARLVSLFRKVVCVLDYEDGRHLIDRGWAGLFSSAAERWGRGLIRAAFVTHPALGARLPAAVPWELVPGFALPARTVAPVPNGGVKFVYTGSLDEARGIDLILKAMDVLPEAGWTIHFAGTGPFAEPIARMVAEPRWSRRIVYHGTLSPAAAGELTQSCHVGLNCQRESDAISGVTFPSKIFSYLSAGLAVISSRASEVPAICGNACRYYDEDSPESLAAVMREAIEKFANFRKSIEEKDVTARYSMEGTATRLKALLAKAGVS